jgi:hypothetical protein
MQANTKRLMNLHDSTSKAINTTISTAREELSTFKTEVKTWRESDARMECNADR